MTTNRVIADLAVSVDTVKRARKAAEEHGLWDVVSKPSKGRPPAEGGAARAAEYRLTMPANWCSPALINDEKWCSPAPINDGKMVLASPENGAQIVENGAQTAPPSGIASGSSSEGRGARADKPLDVETVPEPDQPLDAETVPHPDDALPPEESSRNSEPANNGMTPWIRGPYGPRCHKHVNHPDPPKCPGCRDAREADEAEQAAAAERERTERRILADAKRGCGICCGTGQVEVDANTVARCPACSTPEARQRLIAKSA